NDPCCLHEQDAQVAIAALRYLPRIVRSPVEICLGTSPNHAAKSRPLEKLSPVPIAATMALEMIGPMPGTLIRRSHPASRLASSSISLDKPSMRSSCPSRKSYPRVAMMQPRQNRRSDDGPASLDRSM